MQPPAKRRLLLPSLMACLLTASSLRGDEAGNSHRPKPRPRVSLSKATTYLTEPLTADGYPDYVQALNDHAARGVTPGNNAAVLFRRALGPGPIPEEYRPRFFAMLGMEPLPTEGDYFVSLDQFARDLHRVGHPEALRPGADDLRWQLEERLSQEKPWTARQYPLLAEWLKRNEKPLAVFIEGTRRRRYYSPVFRFDWRDPEEEIPPFLAAQVHGVGLVWSNTGEPSDIGRALIARALLRASRGEHAEAWEDLLASHRLARLIGQGPTLSDVFLSQGLEGDTCAADAALARQVRLSARQARKCLADLSALAPRPQPIDKFRVGERYLTLEAIVTLARLGPLRAAYPRPGKDDWPRQALMALSRAMFNLCTSWGESVRWCNRWFDRQARRLDKTTYKERAAAIDRYEENVRDVLPFRWQDRVNRAMGAVLYHPKLVRNHIGRQIAGLLIYGRMAGTGFAFSGEDDLSVQLSLTRLAFALAAYRAEHDAYPARLADLAPDYMGTLPRDLFSADSFRYKVSDRRDGYVLYSVGPNGRDDAGRTVDDADREGQRDGLIDGIDSDDIAIRVPPRKDE